MANFLEPSKSARWVISEVCPKIGLAIPGGIFEPNSLSIWESEFEDNCSIASSQPRKLCQRVSLIRDMGPKGRQ